MGRMTDYDDDDDDDDVAQDEAHEHEGPFTHAPVMVAEVLDWLAPERYPEPILYDLTLGLGGHLRAWLERAGPKARAFGLDADPAAVERTAPTLAAFGDRVTLVHAPLREVATVAKERGWPAPTSALLDLGLSSPQIEEDARGFSYRREGPLDMRFDPTRGPTAADLLLSLTTAELAEKLERLADEPHALEIVKLIKRRLPVETTTQLTAIVLEAYGKRPSRVHPARRLFQALRILVNDELTAIDQGLTDVLELLAPGGRVVTLSFHSGEDRVVKDVLRGAARRGQARRLTRRPVRPTEAECHENQRARSVKLRCSEKRA
jgi:16S rRNA (cytosine1402-N4)-methyltransferase